MTIIDYRIATIGGSFFEGAQHHPVRYWGSGVDSGIKWLEKIADDFTFTGRCTEQKVDLDFYGKYAF